MINLFANVVGVYKNLKHLDIQESLIKRCLDIKENIIASENGWLSKDIYTTHNKHNITSHLKFDSLNQWVEDSIINYCNSLLYSNKIKVKDGWFNIYNKGDFQECHEHANSHLSCIYCLKGDEGSSRIFFKKTISMFPIPVKEYTETNCEYHWVPFVPGTLYVFESALTHYVEKHNLNTARYSLAYNFILQ